MISKPQSLAVAYIAKVRILEQITTKDVGTLLSECCCLYCKGKNFRANHNLIPFYQYLIMAVAYIAKVRILEQITTKAYYDNYAVKLLLILQR